jgi:hypothetical protein
MMQPRPNPTFEGCRAANLIPRDGRFKTPGMAEAANGERRITELKEAKIHLKVKKINEDYHGP